MGSLFQVVYRSDKEEVEEDTCDKTDNNTVNFCSAFDLHFKPTAEEGFSPLHFTGRETEAPQGASLVSSRTQESCPVVTRPSRFPPHWHSSERCAMAHGMIHSGKSKLGLQRQGPQRWAGGEAALKGQRAMKEVNGSSTPCRTAHARAKRLPYWGATLVYSR